MLDQKRLFSGTAWRRCTLAASLGALAALSGCGGAVGFSLGGSTGPTEPPPGYAYLTGNWQFDVTEAPGKPTFSAMAGFIDETNGTGGSNTLTAAFQLTPAPCFAGAATVPLVGTVTGTAVTLNSFSDTGQFLHLTATKDSTATQLTGTYVIGGGCATGGSGSFTGTRYAPLAGVYAGSIGSASPAQTVALTLTQATLANGAGYTPVSGAASFTGFSCFTTGTLTAVGSNVLGSAVQLTIAANDGETFALTGTFDAAASTITVTSGAVSGGSCSGTLGAATLVKS